MHDTDYPVSIIRNLFVVSFSPFSYIFTFFGLLHHFSVISFSPFSSTFSVSLSDLLFLYNFSLWITKTGSKKGSSTHKLQIWSSLTHPYFTKSSLELLNYPKKVWFLSWTSLSWNRKYHSQNRTNVLTIGKYYSQNRTIVFCFGNGTSCSIIELFCFRIKTFKENSVV